MDIISITAAGITVCERTAVAMGLRGFTGPDWSISPINILFPSMRCRAFPEDILYCSQSAI